MLNSRCARNVTVVKNLAFAVLIYSLAKNVFAVEADITPVFLLAGQSNMEGNVDPELATKIFAILKSSAKEADISNGIYDALDYWYQNYSDGYARYANSPEVNEREADLLSSLVQEGQLPVNLDQPFAKVLCTKDDIFPAKPLGLECGNPFGPELSLGHIMARTLATPSYIVKVVQGGTSLADDWLSPSAAAKEGRKTGYLFSRLAGRIHSLKHNPSSISNACVNSSTPCKWAGFIWFQGENDALEPEKAAAYEERLFAFMNDVNKEFSDPNVPIVVVQIGHWAINALYDNSGIAVADAQAKWTVNNPASRLVPTNDLSRFFHYDPAAQLIIGARIAEALSDVW